MGYYSDVALALTHKGVLELEKRQESCPPERMEALKEFLDSAKLHFVDPASHAEVWQWSNVKWYVGDPECFPEIDSIEELLASIDDENYRFIRIGEDYDDTEARGYFTENPFNLELSRSMTLKPA